MSRRALAVVSAGLGRPSSTTLLANQLAAATRRELAEHDIAVDVTLIELRDHAHDLTSSMLAGFPVQQLQQALDMVTRADGLIAVTPIFNASYSGLFKSFFDVLDARALVDKPVLIGATGGTTRHSLALEHAVRPLFAYLRALVVPTSVFAASQDWGAAGAQGSLAGRIDRAGRELARQMRRYEAAVDADPFDSPTPFEQLLAGD